MNAIKALGTLGQSVWLDSVRRAFLDSGGLQRLIDDDGVTGVTTNPAIFERAIAGSRDYASAIAALAYRDTLDDEALYESLAMADVQRVADLLLPVYRRTNGREGYVSLEVSPLLSQDTLATAAAARRLWKEVDRPNLMIKIPATAAGVPAFEELVAEGLNVNVTLLFSLDTYEQVAASYIRGIQERHAAGQPLTCCASVASFFSVASTRRWMRTSRHCWRTRTTLWTVRSYNPCVDKRPSRARAWPINVGRRCSTRRVGRRWRPPALGLNVCCGRAPAPRIRHTVMSDMWKP